LGDFHALTGVFSTAPYIPGDQYSPNRRILVWDGTWFTVPTKVRLHFFRTDPGQLLYELCVEVSAQTVNETVAKLLIKAVVAALILLLLPVAGGVVVLAANVKSPMNDSVGTNGTNQPADVIYVQRLLSDWRIHNNLPAIGVDGLVGSETIGAIHRFQTDVTGIVDDRVDPNGAAIQALQQKHLQGLVADIPKDEIPVQSVDLLAAAMDNLPPDPLDDDELPPTSLAYALQDALQDYFDSLFNQPL
jgi:peptidoglycan hydrolase-like protein with peptidoglycan-binding domain